MLLSKVKNPVVTSFTIIFLSLFVLTSKPTQASHFFFSTNETMNETMYDLWQMEAMADMLSSTQAPSPESEELYTLTMINVGVGATYIGLGFINKLVKVAIRKFYPAANYSDNNLKFFKSFKGSAVANVDYNAVVPLRWQRLSKAISVLHSASSTSTSAMLNQMFSNWVIEAGTRGIESPTTKTIIALGARGMQTYTWPLLMAIVEYEGEILAESSQQVAIAFNEKPERGSLDPDLVKLKQLYPNASQSAELAKAKKRLKTTRLVKDTASDLLLSGLTDMTVFGLGFDPWTSAIGGAIGGFLKGSGIQIYRSFLPYWEWQSNPGALIGQRDKRLKKFFQLSLVNSQVNQMLAFTFAIPPIADTLFPKIKDYALPIQGLISLGLNAPSKAAGIKLAMFTDWVQPPKKFKDYAVMRGYKPNVKGIMRLAARDFIPVINWFKPKNAFTEQQAGAIRNYYGQVNTRSHFSDVFNQQISLTLNPGQQGDAAKLKRLFLYMMGHPESWGDMMARHFGLDETTRLLFEMDDFTDNESLMMHQISTHSSTYGVIDSTVLY